MRFFMHLTGESTRKRDAGSASSLSYFCESNKIIASIVVLLLLRQCINLKLEGIFRRSATIPGMKEKLSI